MQRDNTDVKPTFVPRLCLMVLNPPSFHSELKDAMHPQPVFILTFRFKQFSLNPEESMRMSVDSVEEISKFREEMEVLKKDQN